MITCVFLDFWIFGAHCLCTFCIVRSDSVMSSFIITCVYRVYDSQNK